MSDSSTWLASSATSARIAFDPLIQSRQKNQKGISEEPFVLGGEALPQGGWAGTTLHGSHRQHPHAPYREVHRARSAPRNHRVADDVPGVISKPQRRRR